MSSRTNALNELHQRRWLHTHTRMQPSSCRYLTRGLPCAKYIYCSEVLAPLHVHKPRHETTATTTYYKHMSSRSLRTRESRVRLATTLMHTRTRPMDSCMQVCVDDRVHSPSLLLAWRAYTHTTRAQPYGGVEFLAAGECISLFPVRAGKAAHYGCDFMGGCDIMRGDNFRQRNCLHMLCGERERCRSLNCIIANGNIIQIARLSPSSTSVCTGVYLMQHSDIHIELGVRTPMMEHVHVCA